MDKNTKIIFVVAIVLIALVAGYMIVKNQNAGVSTTNGPIKIGYIGPLTGDVSSLGTVNKAAVEVAVDEVNKSGGINGRQIQMIYEDGECSATPATNAANKLINQDGVSIIFGGLCSTETSAFGPIAMQKKVVVFSSGSSAPDLDKLGKYFFRDYPSDAFQGKFAAEYAFNTLKAKTVAILYHVSDYGTQMKNVFKARFEELSGKVIDEEGTEQTSRDYRTQLAKIKSLNPDFIFMPTYSDGATVALKQAQALGIKKQFFGGDAWSDPKMQKVLNGSTGNYIYTEARAALPDDFLAKMKAKTGSDQVPPTTGQAYDSVKIMAQVIAQVGLDPDKIADALRQIKYDGVSGHIEFDQNGDLKTGSYSVKKIANGTATVIQ